MYFYSHIEDIHDSDPQMPTKPQQNNIKRPYNNNNYQRNNNYRNNNYRNNRGKNYY